MRDEAGENRSIDHNMPRVPGYEGYQADVLASKNGITIEQAQALLARIGNSRHELDAAAQKLKA